MQTKKQQVGRRGEDEACSYLVGQGHRILQRNWRFGHLEIDVISLKDKVLHIVEVKTRSGGATVAPESRVDQEKRRCLVRAANAFLHADERARLPADLEVQFDVLTVIFEEPAPLVEYYPAAFIPFYF